MNLNHNAVRKPHRTQGALALPSHKTQKRGSMGPPGRQPPKKKSNSTPTSSSHWGTTHQSVQHSRTNTNTSTSSAVEVESRCVMALCEGRGDARCEVGLASINTSHPTLILCQISDSQSYANTLTKINIVNPDEIIVPATFLETTSNRLLEKIRQQFPACRLTSQPRKHFNKSHGMEAIGKLCLSSSDTVCVGLQHKYYALSAAAALVAHLQNAYGIFYMSESVDVRYEESEGYAVIDVSTADRLELVSSMKPERATPNCASLFAVLNRCLTAIGARHLRSTILQPPYRLEYVENNAQCVSELVRKPTTLLSVQALLQKLTNVDALLAITTLKGAGVQNISPRQLNYLLILNGLLELIEPMENVLQSLDHQFFRQFADTLSSDQFSEIRALLRKTINPAAHHARGEAANAERCFAINAGLNGLLDLVRKTYTERLDDMKQYVRILSDKYNMPLTLANNNTKGYHLVMKLSRQQKWTMKQSDLPECFVQVCRMSTAFTMKTHELMNLAARLEDILAEIIRISNALIDKTIGELKPFIGLFYKLCEDVAHLDMLQSLAETSRCNNYVRPKFTTLTEVTNARHPVLEHLLPELIPNSISMSPDYNLHIITGPNGSGKSIYIRQVVLLQVMAQIGCYVPAETAFFRPMQQFFARVYLEDNLEFGASAFILEMKEVKHMLTLGSPNSLFIVDELCRSTSAEEGAALAMALAVKLMSTGSFVCMTTHYVTLGKLEDMYLNVKTWQMETLSQGDHPRDLQLSFCYRLVPGVTRLKHYGVSMIKNLWPRELIEDVYVTWEKSNGIAHKKMTFVPLKPALRLKHRVESELRKLKALRKLGAASVNRILNDYHNELQKLGHLIHVNDISQPMNLDWDENDGAVNSVATMGSSTNYNDLSNFINENNDYADLLEPQVEINDLELTPRQPSQHCDDEQMNDSSASATFCKSSSTGSERQQAIDLQERSNYQTESTSPTICRDRSQVLNIPSSAHDHGTDIGKSPSPSREYAQLHAAQDSYKSNYQIESTSSPAFCRNRSEVMIISHGSFNQNQDLSRSMVSQRLVAAKDSYKSNYQIESISSPTFCVDRSPVVDVSNECFPGQTHEPNASNRSIGSQRLNVAKDSYKSNYQIESTSSPSLCKSASKSTGSSKRSDSDRSVWDASVAPERVRLPDDLDDANSSVDVVENTEVNLTRRSANTPIVRPPYPLEPIVYVIQGPDGLSEASFHQSPSFPIHHAMPAVQSLASRSFSSGSARIANRSRFSTSTSSSSAARLEMERPSPLLTAAIQRRNKRFVPPKRLTRREIQEEFDKQDRELYERSMATNDYEQYMHKVLNRPSVKQVQQMQTLVHGRRTEMGVEVIEACRRPPKKNKLRRMVSNSNTSATIDVAIFSDSNARTFESFVASEERDVKKFNFLPNKSVEADQTTVFNFNPNNTSTERNSVVNPDASRTDDNMDNLLIS